jgi:hypothetical protein
MKYAITGHTQGIGKRAFERLSPDCIGFSKSTGYDITVKEHRDRIIADSFDCDIFINNATDQFGQTYLLIELAQAWQNYPHKKIINVGSRIAELDLLPVDRLHLAAYQAEKLSVKNMVYKLKPLVQCQLEYRWFAYVGTEKILKKYPYFSARDCITEDAAVDIILS